jgi:nitrate/nitrite transporter NarK
LAFVRLSFSALLLLQDPLVAWSVLCFLPCLLTKPRKYCGSGKQVIYAPSFALDDGTKHANSLQLAAAIALMKGIGGKSGWSWIFILEGLATIIVGVVSYWMVHDFPDEARFLNAQDRARVIRRLKLDNQSSAEHEEFKMSYFWASVKDWKTYAFAVVYMGCDGALYAFSLFLPSIIAQLGYTATKANLLSVPP